MSCTLPSDVIDLDMCHRLLSMETPYESAEDLYGDAVDGGMAKFLVDCCVQLRINAKTRRQNSSNNCKEECEDRGRKQCSHRLIPTILFMLYRTLLQLSHPDNARASLPQDTTRVCKRVRVRLAACGLLSGPRAARPLWRHV